MLVDESAAGVLPWASWEAVALVTAEETHAPTHYTLFMLVNQPNSSNIIKHDSQRLA